LPQVSGVIASLALTSPRGLY